MNEVIIKKPGTFYGEHAIISKIVHSEELGTIYSVNTINSQFGISENLLIEEKYIKTL